MKKLINSVKRLGLTSSASLFPLFANAQGPATGGNVPAVNNLEDIQSVLNYVCTIFGWMFYFLIALAIVFGVIGAYRYLTSAGNSEKVKTANNTLLYAAIAVGVALLARSIPLIVASFISGGSVAIQSC
jgi:hypothetical protein